jgi:hypothetical protein
MRANPAGKNGGLYDAIVPAGFIPTGVTDCMTSTCSVTQLANYDIAKWNSTNAQLLSDGKGRVDTNVGTLVRTVTIQWKENDLPATLVVEAVP